MNLVQLDKIISMHLVTRDKLEKLQLASLTIRPIHKRDFYGSMKDAGIFLGRENNTGIFLGIVFLISSNQK